MKNQKGFTLIELLIVIAIIGIIAAIAIPGLLRARVSANEAAVIGDTRTVISASHVFASNNCGYFPDTLAKMITPSDGAIPNYPAEAPAFLDADLGGTTKSGYTRQYQVIGDAAENVPENCMATGSYFNFCYNSTPSSLNLTGVRSFIGVSAGTIYTAIVEAMPACGDDGKPPGGFSPIGGGAAPAATP